MLTHNDVTRILSRYDLGVLERLTATGHGFVNETMVAATTSGVYIVRRNHRRFSLAAQQYRHTLIAHLLSAGLPTAALVSARSGATLVVVDGRGCEVQTFVPGDDFRPHYPAQLASVGVVLAKYHHAVENIALPPGDSEPRYVPHRVLGLVERLLERDVMGELHDDLAWYAARATYLHSVLPESLYARLPHLLIHGDVHSDNLRFVGDHVSALLDFDQVSFDVRLADLADALIAFTTRPDAQAGWGVYRGTLDADEARILLNSYTSIAMIGDSERTVLPILVELAWLSGELGRVLSTPEGSPEYHLEVLGQGKRLSAWIQAQGGW